MGLAIAAPQPDRSRKSLRKRSRALVIAGFAFADAIAAIVPVLSFADVKG